ncbi:FecR family protein [Psychroflexus tropicus]|uniref:FecR family protein n=1 Tax=Psychroflexus tropicus TaxID=197345 RepID=UPI000369D0D2|nr:FecR family protein [Psychroflexus tropicus]
MKKKYKLADWLDDKIDSKDLHGEKGLETLMKIKHYSAQLEKPEFSKAEVFEEIKSNRPTVKKIKFNWSIAASIFIILGVTSLAFLFSVKDFTSQLNTQETVLLPDQSKVILAEDTRFQFNNWFWSFDRTTQLSGQAYFEVKTGDTFIVKTELGEVKVLGTRFDVYSRDSTFKVICYEGSVKVSFKNSKEVLKKGQFVTFQNGKKIEQSNVYEDQPEWVTKTSQFKNVSLAEVIQQLEKDYQIEVDISQVSTNKSFTGTLPTDSLSLALEILSETYQIDFTVINENRIIFVNDEQR